MLTSYCRFDVVIHAEGHHFHAGNCRGVVRYHDLVAKIKIAKHDAELLFHATHTANAPSIVQTLELLSSNKLAT